MNKIYNDGNYIISNSISLFKYDVNVNYTNNLLSYSCELLPYTKSQFINFSISFQNNIINSYKMNIYHLITYSYPKYIIYDYNGDCEELEFYETVEDEYDIYTSRNYKLYVYMDDENDIMNINPIRYKSYYYDIESNMYYLNNRYYNPLICRFITPDNYKYINIQDRKTFNLYTYCNNNPINYADPEGTFGIFAALLCAVIVAATAATVIDVVKITTGEVNTKVSSDGNIKINNSSKIITPWVQLGYSFYLNHIYGDTKDKIKGTSLGVQFEWMCHNVAYYGLSLFAKKFETEIESAQSVDIGTTIFADYQDRSESDDKNYLAMEASKTMQKLYNALFPFHYFLDYIMEKST